MSKHEYYKVDEFVDLSEENTKVILNSEYKAVALNCHKHLEVGTDVMLKYHIHKRNFTMIYGLITEVESNGDGTFNFAIEVYTKEFNHDERDNYYGGMEV